MALAEEAQVNARFDWGLMLRGQFQGDTFLNQAMERIREANALEQRIADRRHTILHNANLSDRGRNQALQEMREALRPRVQDFVQAREEMEATRERSRARRAEPEPEGDPAAIESRAREIRDQLRSMDSGAVLKAYEKAGLDGDVEFIHAVEKAPAAFPVAAPDALERIREERLRRQYPEETQRIEDQTALIDLLDQMAINLERRVEE